MKVVLKLVAGISFCIYIVGCNSQGSDSNPAQPAGITSDTIKPVSKKADTGAFNPMNLPKILQDYVKGYKNTIEVDTSFDYNGKKLNIVFKHYCTYDSALHLPSKYVGVYGLKEFTTHNFKSTLKISSGESVIIDTVITKEIFKDRTFEEEKLYGALLYPNLSFSEKGITIDYSISVPLTDVGVGVSLEGGYDGKLSVKKD
ncbi:MAG: hypothetical protein J0H74_23980 [Chitinophagaceae bacterium]|nr:hypothetical protein [Chitinophagaceae bacterium]